MLTEEDVERIQHAFREAREARKRVAELEAALRESELILTALAMSLNREAVCSDEKLSAALLAARALLK